VIKTPSNINYDLTWGIPDKNGPSYSRLFTSTSSTLPSYLSYMGVLISGPLGYNSNGSSSYSYPTFNSPSQDVLDAWNKGWTGIGKNILMLDSYADDPNCYGGSSGCQHGITTMLITNLTAPGSALYALDASIPVGSVKNISGVVLTSAININVINMSVTWTPSSINCNNGCGKIPSSSDYNSAINQYASVNNGLVNYLSGQSSIPNLNNLSNAVISKAAGNSAIDSKYDLTTLALSQNSSTLNRLLVVGALDKNGSTSSPANLANYSNKAGDNSAISGRFLLANGAVPWVAGNIYMNAVPAQESVGTSFAAPLVAGYAAIVEQKFPNLTATNTANILLQTARYDTLSCYYTAGGCPVATYGAGEASLSRALAPVGRLR